MPYIGEGRLFYGGVVPTGWVLAGTLLEISVYPAAFAEIGYKFDDAPGQGYFRVGVADMFIRIAPTMEDSGIMESGNTRSLSSAEIPATEQVVASGTGATVLKWSGGYGADFDITPRYCYTPIIIYVGAANTPEVDQSFALIADAIEYLAGILSYLIGNQG